MLEEKDLQAIRSLLQDNNKSIKEDIQTLHEGYESIRKDVQAFHDDNKIIKEDMQALHENYGNIKKDMQALQNLLHENNKSIRKDMRKSIVESEKMLLGEMDRMKGFLNNKIEKLEDSIQELTQQYRLNKLDNDTLSLLMQNMLAMQKEIEGIKQQIA